MDDKNSDNDEDEIILTQEDINEYFRGLHDKWNAATIKIYNDKTPMATKLQDAAPYNIFYNSLKHCPETQEQLYSIEFTDLICPSLGKLKASLHIQYMVEIIWLLDKYSQFQLHNLPMTIIYGTKTNIWPTEETLSESYPNLDLKCINIETDFGCHHTKCGIFLYDDDSLRVVVSSANLYEKDWEIFNQQFWVSPQCPKLPQGSAPTSGESPTGFKSALLDYLSNYEEFDITTLAKWIDCVKQTDFSDIKVALLFAVPGIHYPREKNCFFHSMGYLLSKHCSIPAPKSEHDSWEIVVQTSSLGLVGKSPDVWLTTQLMKTLTSNKDSPYFATFSSGSKTKFRLIYPTPQNVLHGYLGATSGSCCMYEKSVKDLQPWLLNYKCQWKADGTKRTRAIAHSKSYMRMSPCSTKMVYYFLTSANLSRSAWGKKPYSDHGIHVKSYEMGVVFLPEFFQEEYFEIMDCPNRKNKKLFPIMFDLPLTPYGPNDDSYCCQEFVDQGLVVKLDDVDFETYKRLLKSRKRSPKSVQLSKKRDMKFSLDPNNDMFFPSFNKK